MRNALPSVETLRDPGGKRDYTRRVFGLIAREYDFITRALSLGRDAAWKRQLIAALPARDISCAVDLACGTGDITRALARNYPGSEIIGIDLASEMLTEAREKSGTLRIHFREADMTDTKLPDESADIVTGGYALRNAPELGAALRETFRILKPGGIAAFLDFSKSPRRIPQAFALALLRCWGGFWGLLLHFNPAVYAYIASSLALFPDRDALRKQIANAGFVRQRGTKFYGGLVELILIEKPGATA